MSASRDTGWNLEAEWAEEEATKDAPRESVARTAWTAATTIAHILVAVSWLFWLLLVLGAILLVVWAVGGWTAVVVVTVVAVLAAIGRANA
jgi:hypothetical protein